MGTTPLKFYRLWCGRRRHGPWMADRDAVFRLAVRKGLAFESNDSISLGPLTWIEVGERTYARSRTIRLPRATKA